MARTRWFVALALGSCAVVVHRPTTAALILDQTSQCTENMTSYSTASEHVSGFPSFESRVADDVFVPAGSTWTVDAVIASGFSQTSDQLPVITFNVSLYGDAGGTPGSALAQCGVSAGSATTSLGDIGLRFSIPLAQPCDLQGGAAGSVYWISVQGNVDIDTAWSWQDRFVVAGNPAHVEYPGDTVEPQCQTWVPKATCIATAGNHLDQCFALDGSAPIIFRSGFDG